MTHEICDQCETVGYCMKFGCIPLQPQAQKPCRSPYCECTPGTCSHPGCYDARSEPFEHPAPVQEPVAKVDANDEDYWDDVSAMVLADERELTPVQEPVAILKGIDEYGPVVDWYKHWVTVPIGTKFYTTLPAAAVQEPVAHLWQHSQTGRTRIVMPGGIITADAAWFVVGPLVLGNTTAAQPAPVEGLVAWVDALFDAIKHGDQDHQNWLQEKLKSWVISNPPPLQPAPVEKPAARKENYSDDTRYGTGGSYAQGGCYGPAAFTDGDHDGY